MTLKQPTVDHALAEINFIRSVIKRTRSMQPTAAAAETVGLQLRIIGGAGLFSLIILVIEFFSGHNNTHFLLATAHNYNLLIVTIVQIAVLVGIMAASFYFLIRRAALQEGEDLTSYVARNFVYLTNFSFFADLLVKFTVLSMVLSLRPDWVAPLLSLFVADYLFQGRLFVLPLRSAWVLALCSLAVAFVQGAVGSPLLVFPLAWFCLVTLTSGLHIRQLQRRIKNEEAGHAD